MSIPLRACQKGHQRAQEGEDSPSPGKRQHPGARPTPQGVFLFVGYLNSPLAVTLLLECRPTL